MHELRGTDFSFGFILYKHGPFSFEMRDELSGMRSDGLITRTVDDPRYGPRLEITERGEQLEQSLGKHTCPVFRPPGLDRRQAQPSWSRRAGAPRHRDVDDPPPRGRLCGPAR